MGGSLKHMNEKERQALKRFGETVKRRLGEYVVTISVFGSKVRGDFTETSDIDILIEQADYGDFYIVSAQEAEAQIQSAREFIIEAETAIERLK